MNNYEKIKNMSIEDMTDYLQNIITSCYDCPARCSTLHKGYKKCNKSLSEYLKQED